MNQSEQINELVKALCTAQSQIKGSKLDSNNPYFKSDYADLTSIWNACKEPLTSNGIAVIQTMDNQEGKMVLITTMAHSSGQWIKSNTPIVTQKMDSQSMGSAITYARRYALAAIAGVCPLDDDAESTMPMSADDTRTLTEALSKNPDAAEYYRKHFNVFDLTTINRNQFSIVMEMINKKTQRKNGEKNEKSRVA